VDNLTLYIDELKKDTIVNEINLKEKALSLPAIKAKWVARLINHKNNLNNLERKKKNIIKDAIPKVRESLPVKLSDNFIKEKAEDTTEVSTLIREIEETRSLIDFLERTEKVISSMSYDMSNIIKIVQLETL
jgi:hypothetical protein